MNAAASTDNRRPTASPIRGVGTARLALVQHTAAGSLLTEGPRRLRARQRIRHQKRRVQMLRFKTIE